MRGGEGQGNCTGQGNCKANGEAGEIRGRDTMAQILSSLRYMLN